VLLIILPSRQRRQISWRASAPNLDSRQNSTCSTCSKVSSPAASHNWEHRQTIGSNRHGATRLCKPRSRVKLGHADCIRQNDRWDAVRVGIAAGFVECRTVLHVEVDQAADSQMALHTLNGASETETRLSFCPIDTAGKSPSRVPSAGAIALRPIDASARLADRTRSWRQSTPIRGNHS
jgi:hypothetical protein